MSRCESVGDPSDGRGYVAHPSTCGPLLISFLAVKRRRPEGRGYVANLPTFEPLLILFRALKHWSPPRRQGRAVLKGPKFFFLRTAPRDHQPLTANCHQPPTATKRQPPTAANRDQPPTVNRCQPPPTTHHQLPNAANCRQPPPTAANHQPPTANWQSPSAANRQSPPAVVEHMSYTRSFLKKTMYQNSFFPPLRTALRQGYVANPPTCGPLLILSPALKRWGPPPPPGRHFLSVYFFSVSFCPCLPGPLGLDKLPPTSPPCALTA